MAYELIISRASPYSSKVRALMGYAGLDHRIRIQNGVTRYSLIKRLTGKTMVPVLRRGQWALNDSSEIARFIMERCPRPTLPQSEAVVLAWLIEDFADEWMVRWMVQSRWQNREDAEFVTELLGRELTGPLPLGSRLVGRPAAKLLQQRMRPWGMRPENDRALQASAERCLTALEAILCADPPYLFAGHPTVADFAVYGALCQYHQDPSGRRHLQNFPALRAYLRRMEGMAEQPPTVEVRKVAPRDLGELQPLFAEMLGTYWLMLLANHRAMESGEGVKETTASLLDGSAYYFKPTRYLNRRLAEQLELVDGAYAERDRLFGEQGMRMERALIARISELCESEGGRRLLRGYDHVGLH